MSKCVSCYMLMGGNQAQCFFVDHNDDDDELQYQAQQLPPASREDGNRHMRRASPDDDDDEPRIHKRYHRERNDDSRAERDDASRSERSDEDGSPNKTPIWRRSRKEPDYEGSLLASSDDDSSHTSANSNFDFNPERQGSVDGSQATSSHSQETASSIFSTDSVVGLAGRGTHHHNHPARKDLRANYRELRDLAENLKPPLGPLIEDIARRLKRNERDLGGA